MGAWGAGSFQNDSALDWYEDFRAAGAVAISSAFDATRTDDYLEVDEGSAAIAAAEVVAAAFGKPTSEPPVDFDSLISLYSASIRKLPDVKANALVAINRVLSEPSELLGLWHEGNDNPQEWLDLINELISRLE